MKNAVAIVIAVSVLAGCAKSSPATTNSQPTIPSVSISNVSQTRASSASAFLFTVSLSQAAQKDASVQYTTVDGTAVQTTDYTAASGTLTITAGQTTASISVQVKGDSLRRANQQFYVQLSNPQNCTLANKKGTGTIENDDLLYLPIDTAGYSTPLQYPGYTLAWSDEFTGNSINTNNWTFDTGNGGWGNNELEDYTARTQNAFVSTGNLIIEARQEVLNGSNYTSARMKTEGLQSFEYGRIDIRAKLPTGQGMWPALWLLGNNIDTVSWPACGEIDMMELLGQQPNKIYGTLHWGTSSNEQSQGSNYTLPSSSFDQQFHVYSLLWSKDSLSILVDDQTYFSISSNFVVPNNPFNNKFFFIFNIAVGGSWPGSPDGTTQFPQRTAIDYVRVFQK